MKSTSVLVSWLRWGEGVNRAFSRAFSDLRGDISMALRCPRCGRQFDVTLSEFGRSIRCPCGYEFDAAGGHRIEWEPDWEALEREIFGGADRAGESVDRKAAEAVRRRADRISSLILYGDMPRVDIEIEIRTFKRWVLERFPGKEELFDALYMSRFRRLWSQFRNDGELHN